MDCKEELYKIMDKNIEQVKLGNNSHTDYLIGLIQMKGIIRDYLKDKEIINK